ncbi:plasmid replication initiation protein [Liquorilactobacillus ghanensis DSM 18630]|uniref:Plasmid replication initiation protein n=1 Tax=Liquorilactobacillus ghanensis DSM 18630 TaxID=1423750 RepID=A0A0R1VP69_9LACO|nr:replication initiator protein A [Liquorilactobacillus ghanensis]KRM07527.1 plasmid replication initiation protein [Liquorilactobacillus ghanensis DSM 18630]
MTSNFYKAKEIYGETFYQLPKVLFTNSKYINLSNDAKVAYALLKDRFNYSIRNNWIDEEDNIYFIFTNSELMNLLLCGNKKTVRIKKELEQVGLLFQKRMGLNKPNRLYLLRPEVEATDVYQQISPQTLGTSGSVKMTLPEDTPQTLGTSGSVKMTLPKNDPQTLGTSGSVKMTHNQYKEQLDTNKDTKLDTQKLNFSTANFSSAEIEKQNRDLVTHAKDFLTDEDSGLPVFLEPEAVQLLSFWCRTPQQMRRFISIILNAKYKVQKDHQDLGVIIPLDDEELKPLMTKTLRRYFNALRSNEKQIKNAENYLYGTMQNLFGVWWNKQIAKEHATRHAKEEKKPADNGLGYY